LNDIALGGRASRSLGPAAAHVEHPGKGSAASQAADRRIHSFFESRYQFGGGDWFQGSTRD
jgi:hypothetical protein